MAWMNQERKAEIAANLNKVMPRAWKWSLSVHHHSTIVLTITEADVDLLTIYNAKAQTQFEWKHPNETWMPSNYVQVNEFWLQDQFEVELLAQFEKFKAALNVGNHDNSDPMTDYFDVGWYVSINLGKWDRPFRYVPRGSDPQPGSAQYEALKAKLAELERNARPVMEAPKSDLAPCWHMPQAEA